jgi:hypothetical protein
MLGKVREDNFTIYYCADCKKQLAIKDEESGAGWTYDSCRHYDWAIVSTTCYYDYEEICDRQYIEDLKTNSVLKIENGRHVFLLIPKEAS